MHSLPSHRLLLPPPPPPPPKLLPSASHRPLLSSITTSNVATSSHHIPSVVDKTDSAVTAFWDYNFLFVSQRSETAAPTPLRVVEGSLPHDFPKGTYYLTGPGLFADDHGSTVHPLDGHGYLRAFDFTKNGQETEVVYCARYVETEAQKEEKDGESGEWRFTHRGPFSVLRGGRRMGNVKVMKNVANTSVLQWGGKLLCLWEGGAPYEIQEGSLRTVGMFDLIGGEEEDGEDAGKQQRRTGARPNITDLGIDLAAQFLKPILRGLFHMPPKRLLSHYKIDVQRDRLLLLSCNAEDMLLPRSNFTFYEFDSDFVLKQKKDYIIPDQFMIHDWAFTDSHYILFGNRIKLDVPGSLLAVVGISPMISALSLNPSQHTSPIYLLPRSSEVANGGRDWRVPLEAPSKQWLLHVGNAFEETDSTGSLKIQVQASVCSYEWFNFSKVFGYDWRNGKLDPKSMNVAEGKEAVLPHLVNFSIELDSKGDCRQCTISRPSTSWSKPADFPAINPAYNARPNAYLYAGTTSGSRQFLPHFPFDSVVKLNCSDGTVSSWCAGSRKFIGEPIFVSRGTEEDDGYTLVVEYAVSKQRCYLVVLDARRIGEDDAVVAKLEVPKHLNFPLGFHGFWADR